MTKSNPKIDVKLENLKKAIASLTLAVATPPVEERDFFGIIKFFEFVYELTWNVLKIILEKDGIEASFPKIVFEKSFSGGVIEGGEVWKDMMEDRNLSNGAYNTLLSRDLCSRIQKNYLPILQKTFEKIEKQVRS